MKFRLVHLLVVIAVCYAAAAYVRWKVATEEREERQQWQQRSEFTP